MNSTSEAWTEARNILCIRLDYLGDVLMSTPAMRALKQAAGRRITLLASPGGAAVARYLPEVDDCIVYAAPWLKHAGPAAAARDLALIDALRARRFDAAVIFTVYSQSPLPAALLCHLAGIPLRLAHCRENPYQLLSHWLAETEPQQRVRHEVQRQLDLVASVDAVCADQRLSFSVPPADRQAIDVLLRGFDIGPSQRFVVLHAGASAPSRRYPPAQWTQVARGLAAKLGCPLLLTGSAEEAPLIDEIRRELPGSHSLAGSLDLGRLGALIARAALLVSNNTGPVHLAAAVGTPVVDLYALTNPQHTPWQVPARVLFQDVPCRYCYRSICPHGHHPCLAGVTPQQVVDAARDLLAGKQDAEGEYALPTPAPPWSASIGLPTSTKPR